MKLFIIVSFLITAVSCCFSQSGWIQKNSSTVSNLNSIKFVNQFTGWCVGDSGKLLKSADGGSNWAQLSIGYLIDLKSIAFPSEDTGYVVGDSGLVIKTIDGGKTWMNLSFQNRILSIIFFIDNNTGYAGGKTSHSQPFPKMFKTTNGGDSWDSADVATVYVNTIFFISESTGWISGPVLDGDIVLKTENGSWITQYYTGRPDIIESIFFIDPLYGWIGSPEGITSLPTIYRTTNGGSNWIRSNEFSILSNINSMCFINRNEGWATGDNNGILRTTNGGNNWIRQTSMGQLEYQSIYFISSLTGWCVGDSGRILKTTTGGVLTGFSNSSSEIPDQYFLSQNYPNPFNPVTNISFGIPNQGLVSLKVYNVLGNEVVTLVNESRPAGSYEVNFDGSNFPSGIYFYDLEVDGKIIDTKRMLLLK